MRFLYRPGRFVVFHIILGSLLAGSLVTTLVWTGCDSSHDLSAKTANEAVLSDKEALAAAVSMQRAFRNIAKSVGPAVVSVNVVQSLDQANPYNELFGDDLFRYFFGDRNRERDRAPQQRRKSVSAGSGFVIDKKGYVLSNFHVVKQASEITVVLNDGREFKAVVVGTDAATDIALLKIDPDGDIPFVALGDSDGIEVGDWAIAIGNPFNLPGTFTVGVVSAKSRGDQIGAPYQNFIQTDTAINPGNSGGPLVNITGQVIGINTMIYTRTGGSLGIGFAIPINIAKKIVSSLIKDGKFERGYIGIYPGPIDEAMRTALKLPKDTGVIVNSVVADGPAQKAGMKDGDVILEIDGQTITSVPQLMRIVAEFPAGKSIPFVVQREWKKLTLQLNVSKRPDDDTLSKKQDTKKEEPQEWLGLRVVSVDSVNPMQLRRLGISPSETGVVISGFANDAKESNLAAGDLIKEINYVAIKNIDDFKRFVEANKGKKSFVFKIKRQGQLTWVGVNQ